MTLLPYLVALVLIFWFMVIRPQQRQRREMQTMLSELNAGADVMLTSGIFGRVVEIDDDAVHVEVAAGTVVRVVRAAIARVIPPDTEGAEDTAAADGDAHDTPEIESGNDAGPEEH